MVKTDAADALLLVRLLCLDDIVSVGRGNSGASPRLSPLWSWRGPGKVVVDGASHDDTPVVV
jgi:hypothetical protein